MTNDQIEKFLTPDHLSKNIVRINFKTRNSILGIFLNSPDYDDLKSKNFWRIVLQTNAQQWEKTGNLDYAKIFNGSEITRLTLADKRS